ncbi:MAG: phage portal protein [Candidatus Azobacteroides sp.]|nr:phage portal protein [Candidatus Azobacteroides sp.]
MAKTLEEILAMNPEDAVNELRKKTIEIPAWEDLEKEYNPTKHPVMTDTAYMDIVNEDGNVEKVTRVIEGLQRLAVERMIGLAFGIPVKRIYKPKDGKEQQAASAIESILKQNRIDTVNIDRSRMLFAGCEAATMWFAVEQPNSLYGFPSRLKLRCRHYSQMKGDGIYPLFDADTDDLIALSFYYKRKEEDKDAEYLDVYTAEKHIQYKKAGDNWEKEEQAFSLGKIPAVYCFRPSPIWENLSNLVYEREWAFSRNGNYLRKNSKPVLVAFSDENMLFNQEKDENKEFKAVAQYPQGSELKYITWDQAIENLKFFTNELKQSFFTQLQLPDISYDNMKTTPMSGESRKMLLIDAMLKVTQESGRLLEMFDREINVIKAFLKVMMPGMNESIDSLQVENQIVPFTITDDKDTISNIMNATGGKPILSQREGIAALGWSDDPDETLRQIQEESKTDVFEPTM